jgi:hypothetical protein
VERAPRLRGRSLLLRLQSLFTRLGAARPLVVGDDGILVELGRDFVTPLGYRCELLSHESACDLLCLPQARKDWRSECVR